MNKIKNTLFSNKPVTIDENSLIMAIESSCDETACAIVKGGREVLANIVIDLCYTSNKNKTFAWDVAGEQIFNNVLKNSGYLIEYPVNDEIGDIEFNGKKFSLYVQQMGGGVDVDFE